MNRIVFFSLGVLVLSTCRILHGSTICDFVGPTPDSCPIRYIGTVGVDSDGVRFGDSPPASLLPWIDDTLHDVSVEPSGWSRRLNVDVLLDPESLMIKYLGTAYVMDGMGSSSTWFVADGFGKKRQFVSDYAIDTLQIRSPESDWLPLLPSSDFSFIHNAQRGWPTSAVAHGTMANQSFVAEIALESLEENPWARIYTEQYPESIRLTMSQYSFTYRGELDIPVKTDVLSFDRLRVVLDEQQYYKIRLERHPWRSGDATRDGKFNQRDIVAILDANKYLTREFASFDDGDFNGSGYFDQLDLVAALQTGTYLQGSRGAIATPEPSTLLLLTLGLFGLSVYGRRQARHE